MTNTRATPEKFAASTWRGARTLRTVPTSPTPDLMGLLADAQRAQSTGTLTALLQAVEERLADQDEKRRVGERLRELRTHSPYTQEGAADAIGVTLRAYQKMEATGGIKFPNLVKLAGLFDVEVGYFYDRPEAAEDRLSRVERKLDLVIAALASRDEQLGDEVVELLQAEVDAQDDMSAGSTGSATGVAGGQA